MQYLQLEVKKSILINSFQYIKAKKQINAELSSNNGNICKVIRLYVCLRYNHFLQINECFL